MSNNNIAGKSLKPSRAVIVTSVVAVAVLVAAGILIVSLQQKKVVNDFAQCKTAGGAIMQTYPEQCTVNGKTFTDDAQSSENTGNSTTYLGMSEADALAKAAEDKTPARVVERDGEQLPTTEDFVSGRHNLSIKDGKVYKDTVEK